MTGADYGKTPNGDYAPKELPPFAGTLDIEERYDEKMQNDDEEKISPKQKDVKPKEYKAVEMPKLSEEWTGKVMPESKEETVIYLKNYITDLRDKINALKKARRGVYGAQEVTDVEVYERLLNDAIKQLRSLGADFVMLNNGDKLT
jgi:hypothetical protein